MSSMPMIKSGRGPGKAKPKPQNRISRIMEREQRIRERSVASAASVDTPAAPAAPAAGSSNRPKCQNPQCDKSDVRDGACQNCGRVVYESNIVAEVTFGESANGAAVVHGSYVAADQGGIRPTASGMAFRRIAGAGASEARERSLREAKQLMNQFAHQLQIAPHVADKAFQLYKVAANSNFIQGRRKATVAAVCVYAMCRKEDNNRVMLIDFADIIKTDVFLLGRCYKDLLATFHDLKEGTKPIIIEDLIFRFASKLEFLHDTNKVALSAVRIAQRMRHDNITHGRRPAGICGAAIIMAARAHNYRRTVREVVYIAKVTMATLQERMEEFANVPSAQMTIRDFHEAEKLPEAAADPPFVIKQSKEWQEKHRKGRKRKAAAVAGEEGGAAEQPQGSPKRQRADAEGRQASTPSASTHASAPAGGQPPSAIPVDPALQSNDAASQGPTPAVDKDGFAVPFRKPTAEDLTIANVATADDDGQLEELANEFGDSEEGEEDEPDEVEVDPNSEIAMAAAQGIMLPGMESMRIKPREARPGPGPGPGDEQDGDGEGAGKKKRKQRPKLVIDEEWELDESNLEREMQQHLNDPALIGASASVTRDIEQTREREAATQASRSAPAPAAPAAETNNAASATSHEESNSAQPESAATTTTTTAAASTSTPTVPWVTPPSKVSDDPIVREDEFADDPEVMYCKLSEEDVQLKEMIWANHNKDYMRKVQQKIFEAKVSKNKPTKPKRQRARKPRIGEGQAMPAGSATEAAQNMLRTRAISTKLDYSRMGNLFEFSKKGPGSAYGGTTTASSVGSRSALASSAGSDAGSGSDDDGEPNGGVSSLKAAAASARERLAKALAPPGDEEDEEEEEEEEDAEDEEPPNGFGEDDYQEGGEEEFDPFGDHDGADDYDE
ncbi:hypothetical protein VTJ83DRAFT_4458 [Remersonia thermophila]|uniref:Cyclin-like domain-containing protein n=1 Tax=Remersonia thermophila TaxID=72144 RepID=A0ABR4DA10_9PEZI